MTKLTPKDSKPDRDDFIWILSVDGSSNLRGDGAGIKLEGPNGLMLEQLLKFSFKASNNQVEYEALIVGMLLAKELGAHWLLAKSDSLLITGQISGYYQAKDPQLASYLGYVKDLRETFSIFYLVHVQREQNTRAYLLSKLSNSGKVGGHTDL